MNNEYEKSNKSDFVQNSFTPPIEAIKKEQSEKPTPKEDSTQKSTDNKSD